MTVSTTITKNSYSANGTLHSFAYGFKIFADADLTVIVRSSAGTETIKTLNTHYVVTNAGTDGGGNVLFKFNTGTPSDAHYSVTDQRPQSGETVVILRTLTKSQGTDYVENDPFPSTSHEDALDRLTFITQELQEEVDRTIKLSKTNTMTSPEFTVGATDRANKILAFDTSGELSVTQELGTYKGTDTTTTTETYVVRDIIKSTTAAQLNNVYICVADAVVGDLLTDTDHFELLVDAVTAATSATNAANSASAASTSESNAATSESNASTSETNAATSASNASTSETNAATSATNASNSATSAASSATTATTKASEASTSATNAATSESNASTSASNAATSATNAGTSETNAATSATTATNQASAASTSATNAATSESNASTSETNAAASAAAAAASADTFDDTYLGSKSSDPSVDNDGDALNAGDLYFNTTSNTLKVYTGSAWQDAAIDSSGFVQTTGDTMTGNLLLPNGAVGTPSIGFASDTNTGIYRGGTDILKFVTAGTDAITIDASQNVDINGTVTADGLTVSTDSYRQLLLTFPDSFTSKLQLGFSNFYLQGSGTTDELTIANNSSGQTKFINQSKTSMLIDNSGDISFYEDTGTTPKFYWDASAERLGVGTGSPTAPLTVNGINEGIRFTDNNQDVSNYYGDIWKDYNGQAPFVIESISNGGVGIIALNPNGGNVGIGDEDPDMTTVIAYSDAGTDFNANDFTGGLGIYNTDDTNNTSSAINFKGGSRHDVVRIGAVRTSNSTSTSSNSADFVVSTRHLAGSLGERFRITSNGSVGIGTGSPATNLHIAGSGTGLPVTSGTTQTYGRIRTSGSGSNAVLDIGNAGATGAWLQVTNQTSLGVEYPLLLNPNGGNVGIGTSSPASPLDIEYLDGGVQLKIGRTNTTAGSAWFGADANGLKIGAGTYGGAGGNVTTPNGIKIDSAGHVTMPYQSAFCAKVASQQSNIATATQVTVLFETELYDQNSDYNNTTYRFTAPVTGKYQLNVLVLFNNIDSAASYYQTQLITSNRSYYHTHDARGYSQDLSYHNLDVSVLADMDAGDTAIVKVYQATGTVQTDLDAESYFTGYLVA